MNSQAKNKLRKLMWKMWAEQQWIDFLMATVTKPWWESLAIYSSLIWRIKNTPWEIFNFMKPEINEHRAKAWHRLESYKRKKDIASGKVLFIASLDPAQIFTGEVMLELAEKIKNHPLSH